jgi:hypothetical protein
MFPIPTLILAAQLAIPVAERGAPTFNTEPTCRGAATASSAIRSDRDVCMQKEKAARDEIDKQWTGFAVADRARCVEGTRAGGIPSYVELLTCLEMAKEARNLPKDDPVMRSTTGSGTSTGKSTTGTAPAKPAN